MAKQGVWIHENNKVTTKRKNPSQNHQAFEADIINTLKRCATFSDNTIKSVLSYLLINPSHISVQDNGKNISCTIFSPLHIMSVNGARGCCRQSSQWGSFSLEKLEATKPWQNEEITWCLSDPNAGLLISDRDSDLPWVFAFQHWTRQQAYPVIGTELMYMWFKCHMFCVDWLVVSPEREGRGGCIAPGYSFSSHQETKHYIFVSLGNHPILTPLTFQCVKDKIHISSPQNCTYHYYTGSTCTKLS